MDTDVTFQKGRKSKIAGAILIIAIFLLIAKCVSNSREDARQNESIATAQGFAKVIRETLAGRTKLVVQELDGTLEARSVNHGWIFDSSQKSKIPYTVQYSVDLSRVRLSDFRYDESTRTMLVQIPNVIVSPPNVDESHKIILERGGIWVSRDASEKLDDRATKLAIAGATASANQPEKVRKAQDRARAAVEGLFELPLAHAGRSDVNVVVRFPTDGIRGGDPWDVSPSIEQVLAKHRAGLI